MTAVMALDGVLLVVAAWLLLGVAGLLALHRTGLVAHWLFPLGALAGVALAACGLAGCQDVPQVAVLPLGLPGLPFHTRLDALSGYFLAVFGVLAAGISLFSAGYFRQGEGTPPGLLCAAFHACLASIALLLVADDAYLFMVAWECMALSGALLVIANHRLPEVRRAAYLYLLLSHVGALALLLCFGLLQAGSGDYRFANMRLQQLEPFWGAIAFFLALLGFGAKSGLLPLHVWLPEAHPAAPSPVSALLSAFVLKTGVYGLLRVVFDLLHQQVWWWGAATLALGLASALFGVVLAAVQTDMKRLLAYSSVENLGLVFAGIGLAILFRADGMAGLAALALTAALYHVASHGAFKSLLFLATGSVLHATGQRNLGRLGGLLRYMPWTGWAALLGALAAAGLPPLGGFVSEWLLLQSFLFTPGLPNPFLNMLIPIVAAVIALVGALAGYLMVKFFGIIFLGQPREAALRAAHDAGRWERLGFAWLGLACLGCGLLPVQLIGLLDRVTQPLLGAGLARAVAAHDWWLLVPLAPARASYAPLLFVAMLLAAWALAWLLVRRLYHGRARRGPPWQCGYPGASPRLQDTAEGFGQPIREIFSPLLRLTRHLPAAADPAPRYAVTVEDPFWHGLYQPLARAADRAARLAGRLQHGRIAYYLLYSFATLLLLLLVVVQ